MELLIIVGLIWLAVVSSSFRTVLAITDRPISVSLTLVLAVPICSIVSSAKSSSPIRPNATGPCELKNV